MRATEELLAAADLLDKRAGEATPGPWVFDRHTYETDMDSSGYDVDGPDGGYTSRLSSIGDARYIATMNPEVGKALADLMRIRADQLRNQLHPDGGDHITSRLLRLARLIVGGSHG